MPEYAQVQTFVACDKNTFAEVIPRFRQVLESVHGISPNILDWLSHLDWPSWEQGMSMDYPTLLLQSQEEVFPARPYLFPLIEEERWADWVELGILLEAEPLREVDIPGGLWKVHAGSLIWRILEAFALAFLENGVYFTDELQDGRYESVVMEGMGNFWLYSASDPVYPLFDAAIVPVELADRFRPIPELFEQIRLPGAVGVAAKGRFLAIPWRASRGRR